MKVKKMIYSRTLLLIVQCIRAKSTLILMNMCMTKQR